jgi:hypothetical protein
MKIMKIHHLREFKNVSLECRKWNLMYVGLIKAAPQDEIGFLLVFTRATVRASAEPRYGHL